MDDDDAETHQDGLTTSRTMDSINNLEIVKKAHLPVLHSNYSQLLSGEKLDTTRSRSSLSSSKSPIGRILNSSRPSGREIRLDSEIDLSNFGEDSLSADHHLQKVVLTESSAGRSTQKLRRFQMESQKSYGALQNSHHSPVKVNQFICDDDDDDVVVHLTREQREKSLSPLPIGQLGFSSKVREIRRDLNSDDDQVNKGRQLKLDTKLLLQKLRSGNDSFESRVKGHGKPNRRDMSPMRIRGKESTVHRLAARNRSLTPQKMKPEKPRKSIFIKRVIEGKEYFYNFVPRNKRGL